MDVLDEFYGRNPWARGYFDDATQKERQLMKIQMDKQNELIIVMNGVANKFIKWSLAKDHFINEVIAYSQDITAKINTGELSILEAIGLLEEEIKSLKEQDRMISQKNVKQAIVVQKEIIDSPRNSKRREFDKLIIAGVGFISGGLQIVGGLTVTRLSRSGYGGLLLAHGYNNIIENGYYILYREDYAGPVRFVYRQVAKETFNMNERDADALYASVDIGISLTGMLTYQLLPDHQRLYRYINTDLLYGLKNRGIKMMSIEEIIIEIVSDISTVYGYMRSN
ncbi:Protein of unknown function (DUF4225) [Photorhabdus temperata subsp. temperata Meg1]|uniref:DUF4225 domain-containing protein n=3 Tax=Photorhabdus TaxID=29487 RepID=A0A081RR40_PHOTE|nr:Protein of unknown function (DUF4225) [Photorhabdus temperata subsp. temperata Meg1]